MTAWARRSICAVALAAALGHHSEGHAAAFAIIEHSAQGMGNAFAGGGAVAEDASTIWFNPASMVRLRDQIQVAGHWIKPTFEFTDTGSVQRIGMATVPLLPGARTQDDAGEEALVPNIYVVKRITERIRFGLAINAPFGLATEYDGGWIGRYQAVKSKIIDLNFNPALAFKLNDKVAIGAGVSLNYIDAELTNAIDFAAVCATFAGGACPNGAVPGQGTFDGFLENEADDISFGFNLGIFYQPTERTRLSAAYRSQINHKLDGTADFTEPAGGLAAVPAVGGALSAAFADDGIQAGVSLPDSLMFSAYHRVSDKIALMGDITWTNWAAIPALVIVYDRPTTAGSGVSTETLNWSNTVRIGLGLNYYHDSRLTLRAGFAWDQSPTPDAASRTPRLPDNDRYWAAIGASYRVSDRLSADIGYAHLFTEDTRIARVGTTANVLNGTYESDADLLSLQVNYVFD